MSETFSSGTIHPNQTNIHMMKMDEKTNNQTNKSTVEIRLDAIYEQTFGINMTCLAFSFYVI